MQICAEITTKMVSAYLEKNKNSNVKFPDSKLGPACVKHWPFFMLCNIKRPTFDSGKWSMLTFFFASF